MSDSPVDTTLTLDNEPAVQDSEHVAEATAEVEVSRGP